MKKFAEIQELPSENGTPSCIPVTPDKKKRVCTKVLRRTLLAKSIVLDNEREENFAIVEQLYHKHFNAKNPVEVGLVEDLAAAFWRKRRLWALENRFLNQKLQDGYSPAGNFGLQPQDVDPIPDGQDDYVVEMNRITSSFDALAGSPGFKLVLLHEGRLHRYFQNTLQSLTMLRSAAKKESGPVATSPAATA